MLKFIAYGDIHHNTLSSKVLTLDDSIKIEQNLFKKSEQEDCDFVLFLGDRFLNREPKDEVKVRADLVYRSFNQVIPHYILVGNHDWVKNNKEWQTFNSLRDLDYVIIMDEPKTYKYEIDECDIAIHALPSGSLFDLNNYKFSEQFNIFVFHDILDGCYRDDDRDDQKTLKGNIFLSDIDNDKFDLVLAGDVHVPQLFDLKKVRFGGGYVGSTLQRTKADANQDRGYLLFSYDEIEDSMNTKFIKSRQFFKRYSFDIDETFDEDFSNINIESARDCLVEIKLCGKKNLVDSTLSSVKFTELLEILKPITRGIDIIKNYALEQNECVVDMSTSNSVLDDLDIYFKSGFVNLNGVDIDGVSSIVNSIMEVSND